MRRSLLAGWIGFTVLLAAGLTLVPAVRSQEKGETRPPDVIYVPTPQEVVDKMLEMADVRKGEIVYDLGCGDGRIPVTAAKKYGVKAFGCDMNPVRGKESPENGERNNVQGRGTSKEGDICAS